MFFQDKNLAKILQVVSIIAVASAFFGFLIVNMYLALYGFWDFNFLKTQYFSAGGLFLFFIFFPSVFFYVFFNAKDILERYRIHDSSKLKSTLVLIAKILIFAVISFLSFVVVVFPLQFSNVSYLHSFVISLGIVWTAIIFGIVATLVTAHGEITRVRNLSLNLENIAVYFGAHSRLLYIMVAVPILLFLFTFFIYPVVPRYFGGGKSVGVSIALDQNFDNSRMGVSNPFNALLIYQSADSVLIITNGGSYLLKQSDISYIKYLEASVHISALQNLTTQSSTTTASTTP